MQQNKHIRLYNKKDTQKVAHEIREWVSNKRQIIFLKGEMGTGKTTFTQMLLHELGYSGTVKSPTYSLIEPYVVPAILPAEAGIHKADKLIYHLDLYRLQDSDEIYFMGLLDLLDENALFLIEWPELLNQLNIEPYLTLQFSLVETDGRLERTVTMTHFK